MMSVLEPTNRLRRLAENAHVEVNIAIAPKLYFRSGSQMLRMANQHLDDGDMDSAFVLYTKYITLFVDELPRHPLYKHATPVEKNVVKGKLKLVFPIAEELKAKLTKRYEAEYQHFLEEERRRTEAAAAAEAERAREDAERRQAAEREWLDEQERRQREAEAAAAEAEARVPAVPSVGDSEGGLLEDFGVAPAAPSAPSAPAAPAVDRSTKPQHAVTQRGLRQLLLPGRTMSEFLAVAAANTAANRETCGVLCGRVAQNRFVVSHLVLPKQSGGPDSCSTACEEEIFELQERHDLITVGWIHTHPTQTAFLSSVDLHTHMAYQLMLPEAVAVVCAPKFNETGFFALTPDHGLPLIMNCREQGFHPHPANPPLFEACDHVQVDDGLPLTLCDLRRR